MPPPIQVLPLGGAGVMGMNLTAIRCGDDTVLVDCGVRFPEAGAVGVEHYLPNLDTLAALAPSVRAVVLTHGHEDHIGAVRFVLDVLDAPFFGTPLTLALVRRRLRESEQLGAADLREIAPGVEVAIGAMRARFVRVTHSIPDCVALALDTPGGRVIHTGDFKIDEAPLDGERFDRDTFRALGDEGVDLLLADSTNVLVAGRTRGEAEVAERLDAVISDWPGRVFVALFASNLFRVASLWQLARRRGRRLALAGRSLGSYLAAGRDTLRLELPPEGEVMDASSLALLRDHQALVLCTGSQAEPRSALARAARGEHPHLRFKEGDLVVFSSRVIPGNERLVHRMINDLVRRGVRCITRRDAGVHASGHARRDELAELIDLVRPRAFAPIHGEAVFLYAHAELARERGVEQTAVVENGQWLEIGEEGAALCGEVDAEPWIHDGATVATAAELELQERRRLARNGAVMVTATVRPGRARLEVAVTLASRGLYRGDGDVIAAASEAVAAGLGTLSATATDQEIADHARIFVRRYYRKHLGHKPEVFCAIERRR